MAKHRTHKSTVNGRVATLARKARREAKYAVLTIDAERLIRDGIGESVLTRDELVTVR